MKTSVVTDLCCVSFAEFLWVLKSPEILFLNFSGPKIPDIGHWCMKSPALCIVWFRKTKSVIKYCLQCNFPKV